MRARKRLIIATLAVGLMAALPGTALAEDATRGETVTRDHLGERPLDRPVDRPTDKPIDRPTDQPTDRCIQRLTDRPCVDDRPTDRCLTAADHPRRCIEDERPHDFNVRKLIWRLIKAHEWEKLVRLLHWLGWL